MDLDGSKVDWRTASLRRYYHCRVGWVDGTTEFHALLRKHIDSESCVLELGAGSANPTSKYLSSIAREVIGLDTDPCVASNVFLTRACVYQGRTFPFPDSSFDAVVSNYVNEHLPDPKQVCSEVNRVLSDGGAFIFRTPNLFHYVALVGRVMPYLITRRVANWLRVLPENSPDPFPAYYRMNTERSIRITISQVGLKISELNFVEKEPVYGLRSRILFFPLMAYERLVNSTDIFAPLRANIFCVTTKATRPKEDERAVNCVHINERGA